MRIAALRRPAAAPGRAHGQSLVEFALVLVPLLMLILGVIQFGLIFNSYVTMTNAAREGARSGTIYVYDRTLIEGPERRRPQRRDPGVGARVDEPASKTGPQFAGGSTWTARRDTYTNGDIDDHLRDPGGVTESDARTGQTITVRATYHQDLIIPMISALLPQDANGRLALAGEVTMVIN